MLQILDTVVVILLVLFLTYIFRGYHLARMEQEENKKKTSMNSEKKDPEI